jgi:hypothetical protein
LAAIDATFGTQVTKIGTREVAADKEIQNLWTNDSPEANAIAQRWIRNAKKMRRESARDASPWLPPERTDRAY